MSRKILVINGHPNHESLVTALAEAYVRRSKELGHAVKTLELSKLAFEPVLRSYKIGQPLEPDLVEAQKLILWAEHIVWVYPNWWGGPPALLKGFIDRTLLPGFAFAFEGNSPMPKGLLFGRSAEIVLTMGTLPFIFKWFLGSPGVQVMKSSILGFCGISPVKVHFVGPVIDKVTDVAVKLWIKQVSLLPDRC